MKPEDRYCEICGGWVDCSFSKEKVCHHYSEECLRTLARRIERLEKRIDDQVDLPNLEPRAQFPENRIALKPPVMEQLDQYRRDIQAAIEKAQEADGEA